MRERNMVLIEIDGKKYKVGGRKERGLSFYRWIRLDFRTIKWWLKNGGTRQVLEGTLRISTRN